MPSDYSLSELAKLADVSPRTVRYYIAQGLLPSPVQQGPNTRYTDAHLDRLRLIRRLQAAHLGNVTAVNAYDHAQLRLMLFLGNGAAATPPAQAK